jgi:hypothetical protein
VGPGGRSQWDRDDPHPGLSTPAWWWTATRKNNVTLTTGDEAAFITMKAGLV